MDPGLAATLCELAEEPGVWLPPEPTQQITFGPGYVLARRGRNVAVHRVRLGAGEVAAALASVRSQCRAAEVTEAVWWVGSCSTPPGLAEELRNRGLVDGEPARMTSLGIDRAPEGRMSVEVDAVADLQEYLEALEVNWAAFEVPAAELTERRAAAADAWAALVADGSSTTYIARLDGEPVGFARAVFTPQAGLLIGGATLPGARGRGVYSSTVLARWREAVRRGVPRLSVSAGPMSAPVLERLGFERLGNLQLLRDRL